MGRLKTTFTGVGLALLMLGSAGSVVIPTLTSSTEFATGSPTDVPTPTSSDTPTPTDSPRPDGAPDDQALATPSPTAAPISGRARVRGGSARVDTSASGDVDAGTDAFTSGVETDPIAIPTPTPTPTATPTPTPTATATPAPAPAAPAPTTPAAAPTTPAGAALTTGRFFASTSPFNTVVGSGAAVDGNSAAMMGALTSVTPVANLVQFGVPVYQATSSTPTQTVTCTATWGGVCPFTGVAVPIADSFVPNVGSDGAMVVVDAAKGVAYEFWRAQHTSSGWTTEWGGVESLSGSGWTGVATATGASRLGGVILTSELQAGVIPHALAVQSSHVCATGFRAPAVKTDGYDGSASCIPAGSHIQLDPGVDLSAISMSPTQRAIAVALQTYGAYVVDSGSAPLSVSFQLASDASGLYPGAAYSALGLTQDYQALGGIPWSSVRVLAG